MRPFLNFSIHGCVFDGDVVPVPDAGARNLAGRLIPEVRTSHSILDPENMVGFVLNQDGGIRFATIEREPVPGPENKKQASYLVLSIFHASLLQRFVARMYFPGDARIAADAISESGWAAAGRDSGGKSICGRR